MIFEYKYVGSNLEGLQECLDHLFVDVWCRADPRTDYDVSMLKPDLKGVINEIYYNAKTPYAEYFYAPIKTVYEIFQGLDKDTKRLLAWMYVDNNCIELLCNHEDGLRGHTYSDIDAYCPGLGDILKDFYEKLYTKVLDLDVVKRIFGDLNDHYDHFVTLNQEDKCPFCGINSIKGVYNSKREAYDHYLPKAVYPFNSVNFRNLAPMCHECNSSYKLAKDPVNARPKKNPLRSGSNNDRKAFYIYSEDSIDLHLSLQISNDDPSSLKPEDIQLVFNNPGYEEQIRTWLDVFGIDERYKAICMSKNGGKYWLTQALDEFLNAQEKFGMALSKENWVDFQIEASRRAPRAEANFIKAEFLSAFRTYLIS